MPVELQAKLLRVLESGEFIKIGETRPTKVDLRIIAATNRDLEKEIAAGNFREDLYFRLSVFHIHLPSLRERRGRYRRHTSDFFAAQFASKMGKRIKTIDKAYIEALERHAWHGNVRELRNVVERSLIMADGDTADLRLRCRRNSASTSESGASADSLTLEEIERRHILRVLEHTHGQQSRSRATFGHRYRNALPQVGKLRSKVTYLQKRLLAQNDQAVFS